MTADAGGIAHHRGEARRPAPPHRPVDAQAVRKVRVHAEEGGGDPDSAGDEQRAYSLASVGLALRQRQAEHAFRRAVIVKPA